MKDSFLIEHYLTRANLPSGETESRGPTVEATEALTSNECPNLPEDVQSYVSNCSWKSKCLSHSLSLRIHETAAIESILAKVKLEQLRKAKERKLKQQLLQLDNEIADAEDQVELARIKTYFYDELD